MHSSTLDAVSPIHGHRDIESPEGATQPGGSPLGVPALFPLPGDVGLSLVSNPTAREKSYRLLGFLGASYLSISAVRQGKQARSGGGERKPCSGFSASSRRSMQKLVSKLRVSSVCSGLFLTLTYPRQFPDGNRAKRDLKVFVQRLLREYPSAAGLWKLEAQKRGAPHFHLIILGVEHIPHEWVSENWYEVVGSGDVHHLAAGTEVRRVKSYQHAVHYVAKYIAKESAAGAGAAGDGLGEVGRRWGHFGNWRAHLGELVTFALDNKEAAKLARVLDLKRLAQARRVQKLPARKRAIRKARRRHGLFFSQFWLGSPDFVLGRLLAIIGRREDEAT